MQCTDPIADMLTRIRNAGTARHATVDVPASGMKKSIAQILLDESKIRHVCAPIEKYYSIRTTQWGPTDGGR